jgi:glycosyltransferase involved in cell wall biosynthesis
VTELRIAVVVPTRNRGERLKRVVAALEVQTLPHEEFEVIFVNDASTDDTARVLERVAGATPLNLRVISQPKRTGPAAARNAGWKATAAPVVAFTDDDCIPTPRWLEAALARVAADPHIGVLQGCTLPEEGFALDGFVATRTVTTPTPYFEACNLFVRRAALEQSGGFDEDLGLHFEDTALGWAVLDAGWERAFSEDALVHHDVTRPGVAWFVRKALLDGHAVKVARDHAAFRSALWRSWCMEPRRAAFAAAVAGLAIGSRWRPALLAILPYAWSRNPRSVSRAGAELLAGNVAVDAAAFAGMIRGWIRWRRFLL